MQNYGNSLAIQFQLKWTSFYLTSKQKAWIPKYKGKTSLRLIMRVYHHPLPLQRLYHVFIVWLLFHILLLDHLLFLIFPSLSSKVIIKHFYIISLFYSNGWDRSSKWSQTSRISGYDIVLIKTSLHLLKGLKI